MTDGVTCDVPMEITINDLNHHIMDCPGILTTLPGADEQRRVPKLLFSGSS